MGTEPKDNRFLGWGKPYHKEDYDWYIVHWDVSCLRTDDGDWIDVRFWQPLPAPLSWDDAEGHPWDEKTPKEAYWAGFSAGIDSR
jgi:hypothetical protein